ncbi:RagB/SusD family nutrient uptake outer membrane protein [Hymenobacter gummosus]|uniref:RagB/SusD family nutrient uptake outer membrane protein n=1 Tax=Hymenobacter gummosus TaxID=1776032 RepID=A0A431U1M2_9BACT|nr:RagB/SusD family nutrient uptake outer membrane protein [Hymenobacter gummosus]RTQ48977.1 RagB/SusD family nutrient uptake outer membrane protein [Hymenobacter gummosus]
MITVKQTLGTLALLGLLTGCGEKWLDVSPNDSVTEENFYQTETDAIQATNAVYSELGKAGQYNYALWGIGDIMADNSVTGGGGGGDGIEFQQLDNFNIPATNPVINRLWGGCYVGIGRANVVIQRVPGIANMSDALRRRCIAEAKFLRAKYYFDLVRAYGEVPLITVPPTSLDQVNIPRSPVDRVYDQIVQDLTEASTGNDLPNSYAGADLGRATKLAAMGLLAKVQLTRGNRSEAARVANETITAARAAGKDLWADYADNFKVANENGKESLFEVQYVSGLNQWTQDGLGFSGNEFFGPRGQGLTPQGGYGFNIPEAEFVNGYETGDLRRDVTIWKPGDAYPAGSTSPSQPASLPGSPNGYGLKKWFVGKTNTNIWDSPLNIPVLRLADVYLILAEADGPTARGLEAINRVRRRAFGLPLDQPSTRDLTASTPNFTDAVIRERRYELAFENDRWFDLKRTGKLLTLPALQAKGVKPFNIVLPIPQSERDANPNLTQNPGY